MSILTLFALVLPHARAADWLTQMRNAWEGVQTYKSEQRLVERVDGVLRDEQVMRAVYRKPGELQLTFGTGKRPAKVYRADQRFDGSVRLLNAGRAGRKLGILTVAWDHPEVVTLLRRNLADLDVGHFVDTFAALYGTATTLPTAAPDVAGDEAVWRVDLAGDGRNAWQRAELCLSQRTNLPARVVLWDAQGVMLERHQWIGLEVNPTLVEAVDFDLGGYAAPAP
jgi:hypothetical protein